MNKAQIAFCTLLFLAGVAAAHAADSLITIEAGASITGENGTDVCADSRDFIGTFDGTWCGTPLLVELVSFTAQAVEKHMLVEWETASENNTAGFHLWRSETLGGGYARITEYLIPAEGGPSWGAEYEYEDLDVVSGRTYYYELEDIDYGGISTFHGPVWARIPLFDFSSPFEVLRMPLASGHYIFYFGLDDPDGFASGPWLGLDSVEVEVH